MPRQPLDRERTLRLLLEYEGTRYAGWQFQTNALSVQETVENALAEVVGGRVRVHGAGRTDAGVHALGQVAHLKTDTSIPPAELQRALNAHLPEDVVVRDLREAEEGFHARFSARSKIYAYTILNDAFPAALGRRFHWWVSSPLDTARMEAGAKALRGRRDFRGFASVEAGKSGVRTLRRLSLHASGSRLYVILEAEGFLWKMARRIVGSLVTVGRGKEDPSWIRKVVEGGGAPPGGPTAPARGLVLLGVGYGAGRLRIPPPWDRFFLEAPPRDQ